jgi:tRNA-Thr(GGU) m(6)t(6)A37 methyltransferase TsaA
MEPICCIKTPFPEKFGVPRQSLLISEALGEMVFPKNDFFVEAFRGLEESSHLWLIFEFHLVQGPFNALVRPPRFENKKKMGVYATRSPHRPNRLGLSVVKFERWEVRDNEVALWVSGVDLVSGTPIFDIKPYVPYSDQLEARSPFPKPEIFPVKWLCSAPDQKALLEKVIALDPRPAQDKQSEEEYGVSLAGYNVRFRFLLDHFEIISVHSD